jgi:GT2 family glycosyltransferase
LREAPAAAPQVDRTPAVEREVTLLTLVHGWPEDVARWLASVERHPPRAEWEVLLVDNSGDPDVRAHLLNLAAGERTRLVVQEPATGWAEAANRGLESAAGRLIVLFDPGTELEGPIDELLDALDDERTAVAGPFGVRADHSLHHFHEAESGVAHAIEGYCLAVRREEVLAAGGFDRKFRFYRIADFELSFRLRAEGGRLASVVPVPVRKHAHRLWEATEPAERDRLSKRNFYRLLDRWRDRQDLYQE